MKSLSYAALALAGLTMVAATGAQAVSIANRDATAHSVQYSDGSETITVEVAGGEEISVCDEGCTLTVNNQSVEVTGDEALEIVDGALKAVQ